jgi:hypothetical protein
MIRSIAIAASWAAFSAFAQGGSAIITLVMPPPGDDGNSAMQSGAAAANGSAGLYHNPALLAELERSTGSQLFLSEARQKLLPVLRIKDFSQEFQSAALVIPDPDRGWDWAVGAFRNHVDFGGNTTTDASGQNVRVSDSYETVYGMGGAIRLGTSISAGAAAKFFDSHLADGFAGSEPASGWAFDLGLFANPKLIPPGPVFSATSITPSLGLVVRNLGPDAFYGEAQQSDPIPRTYAAAAALRAEAIDMIQMEAGIDLDQEWTRRSRNWDPVRTSGFSLFFMGYRYGVGWLTDRPGRREEKQISHSLEYNLLRTYRMIRRIESLDFTSPSQDLEKGYPFAKFRLWGVPFRINPRLAVGVRDIESRGNGIREGQRATFFAFSL